VLGEASWLSPGSAAAAAAAAVAAAGCCCCCPCLRLRLLLLLLLVLVAAAGPGPGPAAVVAAAVPSAAAAVGGAAAEAGTPTSRHWLLQPQGQLVAPPLLPLPAPAPAPAPAPLAYTLPCHSVRGPSALPREVPCAQPREGCPAVVPRAEPRGLRAGVPSAALGGSQGGGLWLVGLLVCPGVSL